MQKAVIINEEVDCLKHICTPNFNFTQVMLAIQIWDLRLYIPSESYGVNFRENTFRIQLLVLQS